MHSAENYTILYFSNYLEAKERSLYLTPAVTFPIQTYFKQSNCFDHLNVGE
jgi:hypothetical protein